MPRRTLSARMLSAHPYKANRQKSKLVELDDIDCLDLLAEFERWAQGLTDESLRDEKKKRFVKKPQVIPAGRMCLLRAGVGYWGDPGREVVDSKNGEVSYTTTESDAATIPLRAVLVVPPAATIAFFFIEREGHSSVGSLILEEFKRHLRTKWKQDRESDRQALRFTINDDAYTTGEQWMALAEASRVDVLFDIKTGVEDDAALKVTPAHTRTTVTPNGPKYFPKWVKSLLLGGELDRALKALRIELPEDYADDPEVTMTMNSDGREKTFSVDNPKYPSVSLLLHDHGEPALDNPKFAARVVEEAESAYSDRSLSFRRDWFDLSGIH